MTKCGHAEKIIRYGLIVKNYIYLPMLQSIYHNIKAIYYEANYIISAQYAFPFFLSLPLYHRKFYLLFPLISDHFSLSLIFMAIFIFTISLLKTRLQGCAGLYLSFPPARRSTSPHPPTLTHSDALQPSPPNKKV